MALGQDAGRQLGRHLGLGAPHERDVAGVQFGRDAVDGGTGSSERIDLGLVLHKAQRPDHVIRRAELYERVWGGAMSPRDRSVDVFVRKLRRKLEPVPRQPRYVLTVYGVGYRFADDRETGP